MIFGKTSKLIIFSLFIFLFLIIAGCANYVQQYSNNYRQEIQPSIDKYVKKNSCDANSPCPAGQSCINNVCQQAECVIGTCNCFVCKQATKSIFNIGGTTSFVNGRCTVETKCDVDNFKALIVNGQSLNGDKTATEKNWVINGFMIGQGSRFSDFDGANRYCNDRLKMTVRWLLGKKFTSGTGSDTKEDYVPYTLPEKYRAECFLDIGVMPVYLLYSYDIKTHLGGANVDPDAAQAVADELNGAGPAVITTEVDFSNDAATVTKIKKQIIQMKLACKNCLIALAPRMGDTKGVDAVLQDANGNIDPVVSASVDIVAFGINTRYANLDCTNPDISDNKIDSVYKNATDFAEWLRDKYQKPSFIPYVLFETNLPWGKDKSCTPLTDAEVYQSASADANGASYIGNAYSKIFSNYLTRFLDAGIIGVAPYQFNSGNDPLNYGGNYGLNTPDRLQGWFGWCQAYVKGTQKLTKQLGSAQNPIKDLVLAGYPNQTEAIACNYIRDLGISFSADFAGKDFLGSQSVPKFDDSLKTHLTCDICVKENGNSFPFDVIDPNRPTGSADSKWCTTWEPFISTYAEETDVDPMLIRAIIWDESDGLRVTGIDPNHKSGYCATQEVSSGKCYDGGYTYIKDPGEHLPLDACGYTPPRSDGQRYCAFGLMQTLDSPFIYWKGGKDNPYANGIDAPQYNQQDGTSRRAIEIPAWDIRFGNPELAPNNPSAIDHKYRVEGSLLIDDCAYDPDPSKNGNFNPFNPKHNICEGVREFKSYLVTYTSLVEAKYVDLDAVVDPVNDQTKDKNKVKILSYYFGLERYNGLKYGGPDEWIKQFVKQKIYKKDNCNDAGNGKPRHWDCSSAGVAGGQDGLVTNECRNIIGTRDFIQFTRTCVMKQHDTNNGPDHDYGSDVLAKWVALIGTKDKPGACGKNGCNEGPVWDPTK